MKRDDGRRPRAPPPAPQSVSCLIEKIRGGGIGFRARGRPLFDLGSHPDQVAHARLHNVGCNTYYRMLDRPATICAPAFAGTSPGDLGAEPGMYRTRTISLGIGQIAPAGTADQESWLTGRGRDLPSVALGKCTLIARRSSGAIRTPPGGGVNPGLRRTRDLAVGER